MKKITTILFDLDGTLIDTAPDLAKALNQLLIRHQRPTINYASIRPLASTGSQGLLKLGFDIEHDHPDFPQLRREFLDLYDKHLTDQTTLFSGIPDLLNTIDSNGTRWGVVTNKPYVLAKKLMDHFKLSDRACCLVAGDQVTKQKPAPDPLLLACKQINANPKECVYIGDDARDVIAAKAANMPIIAVLFGYLATNVDPKTWAANAYAKNCEEILDKIYSLK